MRNQISRTSTQKTQDTICVNFDLPLKQVFSISRTQSNIYFCLFKSNK